MNAKCPTVVQLHGSRRLRLYRIRIYRRPALKVEPYNYVMIEAIEFHNGLDVDMML